jgi:hypothetical protein
MHILKTGMSAGRRSRQNILPPLFVGYYKLSSIYTNMKALSSFPPSLTPNIKDSFSVCRSLLWVDMLCEDLWELSLGLSWIYAYRSTVKYRLNLVHLRHNDLHHPTGYGPRYADTLSKTLPPFHFFIIPPGGKWPVQDNRQNPYVHIFTHTQRELCVWIGAYHTGQCESRGRISTLGEWDEEMIFHTGSVRREKEFPHWECEMRKWYSTLEVWWQRIYGICRR